MKVNPAIERPDSFEDIMANPQTAKITDSPQDQAMFAAHAFDNISSENFDNLVTYIMRPEFSRALEAFLIMQIVKTHLKLLDHSAFVRWAKENKALSL